jgi:hypothetical protein
VLQATALADGATPVKLGEREWTATRTVDGETSTAKATAWKTTAMVEAFAAPLRSTFSQAIQAKDLADYGLDDAAAIVVAATFASKKIDLRIGQVTKAEGQAAASTWVQDPKRPDVVYQLAGVDLHTPFAVPWSELRDRQLLVLDEAKVERIALALPGESAPSVIVQRPALAEGQTRTAADGWQIATPSGFGAGNVGEWVQALKNLSATQFVDAAKAKDTGLNDPQKVAVLTVTSGPEVVELRVGGSATGATGELSWLQVTKAGKSELVQIAPFARDQLLKTVAQLRDRRLFGALDGAAVSSWRLRGPDTMLAAERGGDNWRWTAPAGFEGKPGAVQAWLSELMAVQVDYASTATPTGLDHPEWRLSLDGSAGPVEVALGKEEGGNCWGRVTVAGKPGDPFVVPGWSASKIRKKADDFADKRLFGWTTAELASVTLAASDRPTLTLTAEASGWQLSEGSETAGPANTQAVQGWLDGLAGLECSERAAKSAADASSTVATVTLLLKTGGKVILRITGEKPEAPVFVFKTDISGKVEIWQAPAALGSWLSKQSSELR